MVPSFGILTAKWDGVREDLAPKFKGADNLSRAILQRTAWRRPGDRSHLLGSPALKLPTVGWLRGRGPDRDPARQTLLWQRRTVPGRGGRRGRRRRNRVECVRKEGWVGFGSRDRLPRAVDRTIWRGQRPPRSFPRSSVAVRGRPGVGMNCHRDFRGLFKAPLGIPRLIWWVY